MDSDSRFQTSVFWIPQAKILWIPGLSLCYRQETQEVSLKPPVQFLEKISFAWYSVKLKALSRLIYNQHQFALIWNNRLAAMFKISIKGNCFYVSCKIWVFRFCFNCNTISTKNLEFPSSPVHTNPFFKPYIYIFYWDSCGLLWKAKWCKIQEAKLSSHSTNFLSRSREISIKLTKIKSRSTDFLSRSRHILIKLNNKN